jgi:dTDP-L-rhamnose 4-epimerase
MSAIVQGLLHSGANRHAYDIGSGEGTSIMTLARTIADIYGAPAPQVNGMYRNGDVRSASCDVSAATAALDWQPQVMVTEGVRRLCGWIDERV